MNLAIIIGISSYTALTKLSACKNDAEVMVEVLKKLGKFDEICFIAPSSTAHEAKQQITTFVDKHKSNEIDELLFYYTGHGGRFDDDFFYLFSDFTEKKKETTGLRNTELDALIRNLSPSLTIKIVDACHAGTQYVKSTDDIITVLEKSAKTNELSKIYFYHSSSAEETSVTMGDFSLFTYHLLRSLTQNEGQIRHRDIMAFVTDEMLLSGENKPTFVVQADNTETFGNITSEIITYINTSLKIAPTTLNDEDKSDLVHIEPPQLTLVELIKKKSDEEYCTKEEGKLCLATIKSSLNKDSWDSELSSIFEISEQELYDVPNSASIARWLIKNSDFGYFAKPEYMQQKYTEKEYVKLPKKPPTENKFGTHSWLIGLGMLKDEDGFKLEDVTKTRDILSGISFMPIENYNAIRIEFTPKLTAAEYYALTIVPLFSRKDLTIFYSFEILNYSDWDSIKKPECPEWKYRTIGFKNNGNVSVLCKEITTNTTNFIINDIKTKLGL